MQPCEQAQLLSYTREYFDSGARRIVRSSAYTAWVYVSAGTLMRCRCPTHKRSMLGSMPQLAAILPLVSLDFRYFLVVFHPLHFVFFMFTHGYLKSSPAECILYRDKMKALFFFFFFFFFFFLLLLLLLVVVVVFSPAPK